MGGGSAGSDAEVDVVEEEVSELEFALCNESKDVDSLLASNLSDWSEQENSNAIPTQNMLRIRPIRSPLSFAVTPMTFNAAKLRPVQIALNHLSPPLSVQRITYFLTVLI